MLWDLETRLFLCTINASQWFYWLLSGANNQSLCNSSAGTDTIMRPYVSYLTQTPLIVCFFLELGGVCVTVCVLPHSNPPNSMLLSWAGWGLGMRTYNTCLHQWTLLCEKHCACWHSDSPSQVCCSQHGSTSTTINTTCTYTSECVAMTSLYIGVQFRGMERIKGLHPYLSIRLHVPSSVGRGDCAQSVCARILLVGFEFGALAVG